MFRLLVIISSMGLLLAGCSSPQVVAPIKFAPTNTTVAVQPAVTVPAAATPTASSVPSVIVEPTPVPATPVPAIAVPPTEVPAPSTITIDMLDDAFSSPEIRVVAGVSIVLTFHNEGKNLHNFDLKGVAKTPLISSGQSAVLTFTLAPGTYTFICDVHPKTMTGVLIAK